MESIQVLRERRAATAQSVQQLMNDHEGKQWGNAQQEVYDQKMQELDEINASLTRIQDLHARISEDAASDHIFDAAASRAGKSNAKLGGLFAKWLRGGDNAITADEWQQIRATMSTTTSSEGGYTVQTDVAKSVADALKAYGGMRDVATVIQTDMGNTINFPTSDGTSETGELIAENTTATGADPTFGVVALTVYKFSSKIVAVPFELLQDSAVDVEAFVTNRLIQRIGRATNTYFTTGTGSSQPRGVVTAAASGKVGTTGQTATVIFEDLVDLVHSVDPAYRALGRCRFMMNDASLKIIRKLKDSSNRPIFLPGDAGLTGPMGDSLLGYPIQINQDIATMAANAKSILFGDFSFYNIRDVLGAQVFRFTDSAYVKLGQVGFLMWARSGGNFVDVGGAVKYYANSAT